MSSATQLLLPEGHQSEEIPTGTAGTAQTIERMRQLAQRGKRSALYRELLGKILRKCGQKNYRCYAKSVHDYCTHEIKYVHDPVDVEYVESPEHVLRAGIADCDSKCILFAALCENMGMPVQFVTVRGNPMSPEFTHVYCRVNIPGVGWTASDTTMPNKPFGWEPKGLPEKVWPVSEGAQPEMGMLLCESEGLGDMDGGVVAMQGRVVGMSGLGESEQDIWDQIASGSFYNMLARAKQKSNEDMIAAGQLLNEANKITDANAREQAMQAYTRAQAAVTRERGALLNLINKYNSAINDIRTFSNGAIQPQYLAAVIAIPVAAVAIIGGILTALYAWRSYSGDSILRASQAQVKALQEQSAEGMRYIAATKGIDTQYYGMDPNAQWKAEGKLQSSFTKYALIGGGVLLGLMVIKKMKAF